MTKVKIGSLLALILAVGAWQFVGSITSQSVANPRGVKSAPRDDGRRQVIIQSWWSPGSAYSDVTWRIGDLGQGTTRVPGATPRLPFTRTGWVRPGETVYYGWAMQPGPLAHFRWRIFLSGKVVKEGESKSPVMSFTYVPWPA